MKCAVAFTWSDATEERRGIRRSPTVLRRSSLGTAPAVAIVLALASSTNAQVIPSTSEEMAPPWNAQRMFEPSSLPDLTDPNSREDPRVKRMQKGLR